MINSSISEQNLRPEIINPALIQVKNLQKNYGHFAAVQGINFEVYQGEIFGLIGPDGVGKTTTFHILSGVMESSG